MLLTIQTNHIYHKNTDSFIVYSILSVLILIRRYCVYNSKFIHVLSKKGYVVVQYLVW